MSADQVSITVDGVARNVPAGRSVAAALLAIGVRRLRASPREGAARGAFCMMGVCQECLVRIDGRQRQACMVTVRPGLAVQLTEPG
jgi:D-hydroxyproline dehydrogenase subunit gamma